MEQNPRKLEKKKKLYIGVKNIMKKNFIKTRNLLNIQKVVKIIQIN